MPTSKQTKTLYSLAEAAVIVGLTQSELLEYGSCKDIRLCVRVPPNTSVYEIDQAMLDLEKRREGSLPRKRLIESLFGYVPIELADIEMLFLDRDDCSKVLSTSGFCQSVFQAGCKFDKNFNPILIVPTARKAPEHGIGGIPAYGNQIFATYQIQREEAPFNWQKIERKEIILALETLYVTREDLQTFERKKLIVVKDNSVKRETDKAIKITLEIKPKGTKIFAHDLEKLLTEIANRMENKGGILEGNIYPFYQKDLHELFKKYYKKGQDLQASTFKAYVKGYKFRKGAPSKSFVNPLVDLFPEHYQESSR